MVYLVKFYDNYHEKDDVHIFVNNKRVQEPLRYINVQQFLYGYLDKLLKDNVITHRQNKSFKLKLRRLDKSVLYDILPFFPYGKIMLEKV